MAYQINSVNIPSTIYNTGNITPPTAEVLVVNGQSVSVASRIKTIRWSWASMSTSDFDWWTQTILSNGESLRCGARLPNETRTETAYTTVVVRKPTTSGINISRYKDVELTIEIFD